MRPPAFASPGQWFRGNLHTHSDRSDGVASPEQLIAEYRAAGYDILVLTDHFESRWGWTVTDTDFARDDGFTTLLGAELSSADWEDEGVFWVNAIGLPADFGAPARDEPHAASITRAAAAGAYDVLLHPGLTNFLDFDRLPTDALDAVETYDVNAAHSWPDTQGPVIEDVHVDGDRVHVTCSPARAIALTGIHGWRSDVAEGDPAIGEAVLDLDKLRSPYWRLTVTAPDGRRAWTNPVWPA